MTTCRATSSDPNDYFLIHLRILICSVMACLLRWVEGGVRKQKKRKKKGQYALSGRSLTQQVETNQQQALVVCLGGNILIP